MVKVYYETKNIDGQEIIITTDKSFWDANGYVDDGEGKNYIGIMTAMEASGAAELSESIYEMPSSGINPVIKAMRAKGYELVKNEEFTKFINSTD